MRSKEIVKRTLDFESPERVARSFRDSDFRGVGNSVKTRATQWEKVDDIKWKCIDEWGNTWARITDTDKGEVEKGVLENISDIDDYEFPDYSDPSDFEITRQRIKGNKDYFINGGVPGFTFNIARKLVKVLPLPVGPVTKTMP